MSSTGFLINYDEARRSDLIKERASSGVSEFSDALSVSDWVLPDLSIALISFDNLSLSYLSLAKKGNNVATSKKKIQFVDILSLDELNLFDIEQQIDARLLKYFINSSNGHGKLIPPATFIEVIAAIKSLRPRQASEIDRLLSLQKVSRYRIKDDNIEILHQEREAVGAALDIFAGTNKLRSKVLSQWAPSESMLKFDDKTMEATFQDKSQSYPSFFDGLSKEYFTEEDALQHDLMNYEGLFGKHKAGITKFEIGNRKLEIIYANRNGIEKALGVDLVYFNPNHDQFVMVQYKMMKGSGKNSVYRPDTQFNEELQRMESFSINFPDTNEIRSHEDYRLLNDGFLFKFVRNSGFQPGSGELIPGMYITREYMKFLTGVYGPKGPKGGTIITEETARRHLTNTEFSNLVNRGWIGTRNRNSSLLYDLITETLRVGRKVVFAREEFTDDFYYDQQMKSYEQQEELEKQNHLNAFKHEYK